MTAAAPPPARGWAALKGRAGEFMRRGVVRSIGVLVGGTATAHAITALAMPVSTRLFTPADFSAAAAFSSIVGILSVAACLRFDMAIALPEDDVEAADLLALSALCALGAAALAAFALVVLPDGAIALLRQPRLTPWLWLVPVGVLIGGLYLALQMWFARRRDFAGIARSRIAQSASAAAGQIGLGAAGFAPLGLIVGQLLNYGAGSLWLGLATLVRERAVLARVSVAGMIRAVSTHRRFPLYSTWEALANAASIQAPILLIAALASGPEAGYLTLAIFLMQTPMALLGNAIGQVYVSGASEAHREGRLGDYTRTSLDGLARASAAPMAFLAVASPVGFEWVFGSGWGRAGVLVSWMAPWFFLQFLATPVSSGLHVAGRQRAAMILQVAGLALRVGAVVAAERWYHAAIAEAYALSGVVFYALYLAVILAATGLPMSTIGRLLRVAAPFALVGASAGAIGAFILSRLASP